MTLLYGLIGCIIGFLQLFVTKYYFNPHSDFSFQIFPLITISISTGIIGFVLNFKSLLWISCVFLGNILYLGYQKFYVCDSIKKYKFLFATQIIITFLTTRTLVYFGKETIKQSFNTPLYSFYVFPTFLGIIFSIVCAATIYFNYKSFKITINNFGRDNHNDDIIQVFAISYIFFTFLLGCFLGLCIGIVGYIITCIEFENLNYQDLLNI